MIIDNEVNYLKILSWLVKLNLINANKYERGSSN